MGAVKATVKIIRDKSALIEKIKEEMVKIKTLSVVVGIVKDNQYEDGTTVGQVAVWNEFGTGVGPAPNGRPFFRPAMAETKEQAKQVSKQEVNLIMKGQRTAEQGLKRLGILYSSAIVKKIQSNVPPPNDKATLKRKAGTKTLIDSRLMLRSVGYEVKEKE